MSVGKPLANYAAYRKAGDYAFLSGVIAVDPARSVVTRFDQLPPAAREELPTVPLSRPESCANAALSN